MPRELKPHEIEVLWHPNRKDTITIFFDRTKKVFFASIGMERVEHTDLVEARKLARDLVVRAPRYEWEAVIVVDGVAAEYDEERHTFGGSGQNSSQHIDMSFRFYRGERCKSPTRPDGWLVREHTADFEERLARRRVKLKNDKAWSKEDLDHHEAKDRESRATNQRLEALHAGDDDRVLPYSDELWRGLMAIKEAIKMARRSLSVLIDRPDLDARLRAFAAKPLPPMLPAYEPVSARKGRAR